MGRFSTLILLFVMLYGVVGTAGAETRRYIQPGSPGTDDLPFSGAVETGDTLYVSGHIGLQEDLTVPDDPKAEAKLLMDQFQSTMAEAGYTLDDLVTVTVYCSDVKHYKAFNEVYRSYFKKSFPPRAFIGSGPLLFDARFEMQGVAVRRSD